jgi:uncharacterized protein YdaU (DUF1376 family)
MARNKLPYYSMYPSDFDTDEKVRGMTDEEVGFFVRCLNHSWINGSIPADLDELARILQRDSKYVHRVWRRVGRCFVSPIDQQDRLVNPRQEEERALAEQKSEKAREKVNKRWAKQHHKPYSGNAVVSDQYDPGNTLQNQNQNTPPVAPYELPEALVDAFHRLKDLYPNATDVDFGFQIWMGYCESGVVTEENVSRVFDGLSRWLESDLWSRENGRYIQSFAKWLHGKKWLDSPAPSAEAKASKKAQKEWRPVWEDEHGNVRPEYRKDEVA